MRSSPIAAVVAIVSLGLAACGGGDDSSGLALDRPAQTESDPSTEVQDAVETLEDLGIDVDDLADDDTDLDELLERADDFVSGFGGDGGGTFIVNDVTYTMVADVCIAFENDLVIDGPATGSDGSVAWASLNRSVLDREEMAEFVDEMVIDSMFPDGADEVEELNIEINVGATGRFDSNDDQPSWRADVGPFLSIGDLQYEVSGRSVRGEGQAQDANGVAADFNDLVSLKFEAGCS